MTNHKNLHSLLFSFFLLLTAQLGLTSCASSTNAGEVGADRPQMLFAPASAINDMSRQGYEDLKKEAAQKGTLDRDTQQLNRMRTITQRLIPATAIFRSDAPSWQWEVHVIQSDEINAFCMPGGKIIVYTGILNKLKLTDGEAAAVLGHEIAHALREHGRERMSEQMLQQGALVTLVATGKLDPNYAGAAATVSNLLVTLPHGRRQESEADKIGVELMARAGYNPEEALGLWKKMGAAGGGKPPEFLSTHPSDDRRLNDIQNLLPKVRPLYHP